MLSCESRRPLSWPGVVAAVSNERGGDEHMRSRSKLLREPDDVPLILVGAVPRRHSQFLRARFGLTCPELSPYCS